MKIYRLMISLLLPGLAIFLAALAQHVLTMVWPGVREIRFPVVSADSYFGVLCSGILCFLAGYVLGRDPGGWSRFVCAVTAPLAFLCLFLWALLGRPIVELDAKIAWLSAATLFAIAASIVPLLGVALGWSYSGARSRRARGA